MRNRKDINCLSTEELHELREGLAAMYALPAGDPNSFARVASFHGGPPTAYCEHGSPGFFTWHRAYMFAFENALRPVACDVALPYWNWSSGPTTGVPAACREPTYMNRSGSTVANPLYSGPRPTGGQTSRGAAINTTVFDDLATSTQSAMGLASFSSFQNSINGIHGSVHVRTGGDMGSVPTAAYDPIFYLHHGNIDRIWALWQVSHPGALPPPEASLDLLPFNRPYALQWQQGSDMESTTALGYRYRRFCFFLPPFDFWEVVNFKWPLEIRREAKSARLVIRSAKMQSQPMEIRAFLNQGDASGRTMTIGNDAFAGAAGFFGHQMQPAVVGEAENCEECTKLGNTHEHAAHEHTGNLHSVEPISRCFNIELDLTVALANTEVDEDVTLKLVAVDGNGNELRADQIQVEGFDIEID